MPCYVTGTAEGDARLAASEASAEATKVTQMLCGLCGTLESFFDEDEVKRIMSPTDGLRKWWLNHKKVDDERRNKARFDEIIRLKERLREMQAEIEKIQKNTVGK